MSVVHQTVSHSHDTIKHDEHIIITINKQSQIDETIMNYLIFTIFLPSLCILISSSVSNAQLLNIQEATRALNSTSHHPRHAEDRKFSIRRRQQQRQRQRRHNGPNLNGKRTFLRSSSPEMSSWSIDEKREVMELLTAADVETTDNGQLLTYKWDRNHHFPTSDHVANSQSSSAGTSAGHENGTEKNGPKTPPSSPDNNHSNDIINNSKSDNQPSAVLIIQDASPGSDEEVLYVTSKVNRAYAKRWGFDYLQFTGIANGGSSSWQATFNKPFLLNQIIQARAENRNPNFVPDCYQDLKNSGGGATISITNTTTVSCLIKPTLHTSSYDIVMLIDSSAIIVQLDYNIINLIQSDKMIATSISSILDAQNINKNNNPNNNNADVMLWNLNHPQTMPISNQWLQKSVEKSNSITKSFNNDEESERILSEIIETQLDSGGTVAGAAEEAGQQNDLVNPIPNAMIDGLRGTLIKQDMSYNYYVIDDPELRKVMPILSGIVDSVCYRFYPQCEVI